jgi:hypothetical protein
VANEAILNVSAMAPEFVPASLLIKLTCVLYVSERSKVTPRYWDQRHVLDQNSCLDFDFCRVRLKRPSFQDELHIQQTNMPENITGVFKLLRQCFWDIAELETEQQFNSTQFNSIQFNSIQLDSFTKLKSRWARKLRIHQKSVEGALAYPKPTAINLLFWVGDFGERFHR